MKNEKCPAGGEAGTRYGPFVVLEAVKFGRGARVRLRCDCGGIHESNLKDLKVRAAQGSLYGCKSCQKARKIETGMAKFDPSRYLNKKFGRLLVTGVDVSPERKRNKSRLVCLCDCGGQAVVVTQSLVKGKTTSCGCFHAERLAEVGREVALVHGNTSDGELNGHTSLYRAWMKIKSCCKAGKEKGVGLVNHDYDPRWTSFSEFFLDFGPIGRYQTISRTDNSKPWDKSNCYVNAGRRHLFERRA